MKYNQTPTRLPEIVVFALKKSSRSVGCWNLKFCWNGGSNLYWAWNWIFSDYGTISGSRWRKHGINKATHNDYWFFFKGGEIDASGWNLFGIHLQDFQHLDVLPSFFLFLCNKELKILNRLQEHTKKLKKNKKPELGYFWKVLISEHLFILLISDSAN